MTIKGLISQAEPKQNGVGKNGNPWVAQSFVLDYFWWPNQTVPTKAVFRAFGEERVKDIEAMIGKEVEIRYHIEMREHEGRKFNEVRFDGFVGAHTQASNGGDGATGGQSQGQTTGTTAESNVQHAGTEGGDGTEDDLPF